MILNAPCSASAATSPEICEIALPRLPPVRPKTGAKFGGSVPPELKKLLMAVATFCWLTFNPPPAPSFAAVRVRSASLGV